MGSIVLMIDACNNRLRVQGHEELEFTTCWLGLKVFKLCARAFVLYGFGFSASGLLGPVFTGKHEGPRDLTLQNQP